MASATKLLASDPIKMLITGFPGAGKTGSLACLLNAGWKIRMLDYDGNYQPLLQYANKEALPRLDIVSLEDSMGMAGQYLGVKGVPSAFVRGVNLLDRWRYPDPEGCEVDSKGQHWTDLGSSSTWGLDTIVVLDGLTGMGEASKARAMAMANKTPGNMTQAVWGMAMQEQMGFIKRLTSTQVRHHVIVLSHLVMIGPKEIGANESPTNVDIKERLSDLIPTRYHPSALGRALPPLIAAEFPIAVNVDLRMRGKTAQRTFNIRPREDMDLKLPVKAIESLGELPVEDGLLTLFRALGATPGENA